MLTDNLIRLNYKKSIGEKQYLKKSDERPDYTVERQTNQQQCIE